MANPIKQLAGETAVYGLSTILARIINFFLVPLYTRVLTQSDYGVVTEFMSYIAVLQVVLILGLETGCFRFANKEGVDRRSVFSNAFYTVTGFSALFFVAACVFAGPLSTAMGYAGYSNCIIYLGGILLMDCSTSIIFAKLRYEQKALKFAVIKTIKIVTEACSNLVFFLWLPGWLASRPQAFILRLISPVPDFSYAMFAVFLSCIVCVLLLLPDIFRTVSGSRMSRRLVKELLIYSLPLMVAGLPGILNDFMDRLLMRWCIGDSADVAWRASLGVYQAGVKVAVIMNLFIQMYRYAAEPFFFRRMRDRDSRELYSTVMTWFVGFCMLVFLGVILYIDVIGLMLGRNFREGLSIAPVMLMAYACLGISINVNMWFKLSNNTGCAIWVTLAGLLVTILINVLLMPKYNYHAAAWAHLASYAVMIAVSLLLSRKRYWIGYDWRRPGALAAAALALFGVSRLLPEMALGCRLAVHTALIAVYLVFWIVVIQKVNLKSLLRGNIEH